MINTKELKPGDLIYCIERDPDDETGIEVSGYIFVAANEECIIVSADPVGYEGTISQYLLEETRNEQIVDAVVLPPVDCYKSQREAHAAAEAEMEAANARD